jgi:hypothetical protein
VAAQRHLAGIRLALHEIVEDLWKSWTRSNSGTWTCLSAATLDHPNGRIQVTPGTSFAPGTMFMGVDVAAWLDEQVRERDAWRKQG